jgi:hypothetical protein
VAREGERLIQKGREGVPHVDPTQLAFQLLRSGVAHGVPRRKLQQRVHGRRGWFVKQRGKRNKLVVERHKLVVERHKLVVERRGGQRDDVRIDRHGGELRPLFRRADDRECVEPLSAVSDVL